MRTYDDGNVDCYFNALSLKLNFDEAKGVTITSAASSSSIADKRAIKLQKKQRTAAWAMFVKDMGILRTRAPGEVGSLEIVCEFMNFFKRRRKINEGKIGRKKSKMT